MRNFDMPGGNAIVVVVTPECEVVGSNRDSKFFMVRRFGGAGVAEAGLKVCKCYWTLGEKMNENRDMWGECQIV